MKNFIYLIILLFFFNALLYVAFEVNKFFGNLILSIFVIFNFYVVKYVFEKLKKDSSRYKVGADNLDQSSAEDHPIIKSARKRLGR